MLQGDSNRKLHRSVGGGQDSGHGVHLCHACRWTFPNPHPSAKQRRAHKKHCGKIKGYPLLESDDVSDDDSSSRGSTTAVAGGELKSGKERNLGGDSGIKEVNGSGGSGGNEAVENQSTPVPPGAPESKEQGKSMQLIDSPHSDDIQASEDKSSAEQLENGKEVSTLNAKMDSLIVERTYHEEGQTFASEDLKMPAKAVREALPNDYAVNLEDPKPDPCPTHEEKTEAGQVPKNDNICQVEVDGVDKVGVSPSYALGGCPSDVANSNMNEKVGENLHAPSVYMSTGTSEMNHELPQNHEPMDPDVSFTSSSAEILGEAEGHSKLPVVEKIQTEMTCVELGESVSSLSSSPQVHENGINTSRTNELNGSDGMNSTSVREIPTMHEAEISDGNVDNFGSLEPVGLAAHPGILKEASPEGEKTTSGDTVISSVKLEESKTEDILGENVAFHDLSPEVRKGDLTDAATVADSAVSTADTSVDGEIKTETDLRNNSHKGTGIGNSDEVDDRNQEVKEMDQSQRDLKENDLETNQELTNSTTASVAGLGANDVTGVDNNNLDALHSHAVGETRHKEGKEENSQLETDVNPEFVNSFEAESVVQGNEPKADLEQTKRTLPDCTTGLRGADGATGQLEHTSESNSDMLDHNIERIQERSIEHDVASESTHPLPKAEACIGTTKTENLISGHPYADSVSHSSDQVESTCNDLKLPKVDGHVGSSVEQSSNQDPEAPEESNTVVSEGVAPNLQEHPSEENVVTVQNREIDAALSSLDAAVDSTSQADSTEGHWGSIADGRIPSARDLEDVPATNLVAGMSVEPHASNIDPGRQTASTEVQPTKKIEQSNSFSFQDGQIRTENESLGRNKDEEIVAKVVNWRSGSGKLHTPLKNLLVEANVDGKQTASPNAQEVISSPKKESRVSQDEHRAPKIQRSTSASRYSQPATKTAVQKEWNSPARLPPNKNAKGKSKGKPQWVPFMCCSTDT